jgi:hypothetical protein
LYPKNIPAIITPEKISGSHTCNFLFTIVYVFFVI